MMIVEEAFEIGGFVYLKTDPEQLIRVVTGITIRPGGLLEYKVSNADNETTHYEIELSLEPNILAKC
jgi:hypothetical protein